MKSVWHMALIEELAHHNHLQPGCPITAQLSGVTHPYSLFSDKNPACLKLAAEQPAYNRPHGHPLATAFFTRPLSSALQDSTKMTLSTLQAGLRELQSTLALGEGW